MVYMYIGIAGALGAITRYLVNIFMVYDSGFPFSTLLVNLIGCYALAYITSRALPISSKLKVAIGTGFLGSFTTFSTFSVETITMIEDGQVYLAVLYIILSILGGILMSNFGWKNEVSK
ncbi:fluoride efflux transporter CrcB [Psychrobacillus psychrodurans]|uniref:fluoride efflux transporter CrcB n=1 Tax=Psychrobacillus TaxID=1221880 RepID=UPI0008E90093|nr:fluoride efflux transporter CrcB [Psychrobacillus psychrodurans]MCK1996687.1 fluoride efflux transporter CrcB [Psychrobacillus psychrodurans]MCZ8541790.1 fluoride efflux transporter CrcB [Psychrobacillus psychrodurans]SFN01493.1 CrcB protein [Psychrobacillus psychrodurans]